MKPNEKRRTLTKIRDTSTHEVGEVLDLLSEQFTADMNGKVRFYFWRDRNVTWEIYNDTSNCIR
jgi:hypothetical protein